MENNQIIELLKELANQLGIAVDWTSENIKPFIIEIMNRNAKFAIFSSVIWMLFAMTFMVLSIVAMYKMIKSCGGIRWVWHDDIRGLMLFAILTFIVSTFIMFCKWHDIGEAILMPEVVLIERLKQISQ
jgi:p-aminobenzoyl-glutamate transporter AbgT